LFTVDVDKCTYSAISSQFPDTSGLGAKRVDCPLPTVLTKIPVEVELPEEITVASTGACPTLGVDA